MKDLIVNKKYHNKKLSKFILDSIPELTFNNLKMILRKKDIKVNDTRISKDCIIQNCDKITIYIPNNISKKQLPKIDKFYEDKNILIINKPQNLEVTGTNSLTTLIHEMYSDSDFKPMPCHRLDRNTCGLILFAKNQKSLDILLKKFKKHELEKHYYAWVYSIPKENTKKMTAYLFKDNKKSMVYISDIPSKGYQKIITNYTVIKKYNNNTCLLDIEILTGKTHQIRAHLAHIGLPIIGDGKYGKNQINKNFKCKYQCLCSYKIKFNFNDNNGILDYLDGKEFLLTNIVK